MSISENTLNKLTAEQKEKLTTAKTPEELLAIAKETGYELSPDELEAVSGGWNCAVVCHGYKCYDFGC